MESSTNTSPVDRTRPACRTRQMAWSGTTGPVPSFRMTLWTALVGSGDGDVGGDSWSLFNSSPTVDTCRPETSPTSPRSSLSGRSMTIVRVYAAIHGLKSVRKDSDGAFEISGRFPSRRGTRRPTSGSAPGWTRVVHPSGPLSRSERIFVLLCTPYPWRKAVAGVAARSSGPSSSHVRPSAVGRGRRRVARSSSLSGSHPIYRW